MIYMTKFNKGRWSMIIRLLYILLILLLAGASKIILVEHIFREMGIGDEEQKKEGWQGQIKQRRRTN
jgi:hypothetical protein